MVLGWIGERDLSRQVRPSRPYRRHRSDHERSCQDSEQGRLWQRGEETKERRDRPAATPSLLVQWTVRLELQKGIDPQGQLAVVAGVSAPSEGALIGEVATDLGP